MNEEDTEQQRNETREGKVEMKKGDDQEERSERTRGKVKGEKKKRK